MNKIISSSFQVPQVILLTQGPNFKPVITFLIKKIICLDEIECQKITCKNCVKLNNNSLFDLKWIKLTNSNILKKQDSINIIDKLLVSSFQVKSPKIYVIEQIEYSTTEASNVFLKFLENLNDFTYLIFTTNNISDVLPTIKSRCQIFDFMLNSSENKQITKDETLKLKHYLNETFKLDGMELEDGELKLILNLVNKFIINDNENNTNNNFFLIKELVQLKLKSLIFIKILHRLIEYKLIKSPIGNSMFNNAIFKKLVNNWKNDNKEYLCGVMEKIILFESQFNYKANINLLLNDFFININKDRNYAK